MTDKVRQEIIPLIEYALGFAEVMLSDTGEFYPFGAKIESDRSTLRPVAYYDGIEFPDSEELISSLDSIFNTELIEQKIIASSIVYDVKAINPNTDIKSDAICIKVRHVDVPEIIYYYYPYSLDDKNKATIGNPWAELE